MGSLLVSEVVHDTHFPWSTAFETQRPHSFHPSQQVLSSELQPQRQLQRPLYPSRTRSDISETVQTSMAQRLRTNSSTSTSTSAHAPDGVPSSIPAQQASQTQDSSTPMSDEQNQTPSQPQPLSETPSTASGDSQPRDTYAPLFFSPTIPSRTKIKSLKHIETIVEDESNHLSALVVDHDRKERGPTYDISNMPIGEVIEMVAGLLMKITTTNDKQYQHLHHHMPPIESSASNPQIISMTAFHGRCVPNISILAYLNRINKYCPTTYEVFLSLLVYLDRMSGRVNSEQLEELRREVREEKEQQGQTDLDSQDGTESQPAFADSPPSSRPGSSSEVSLRDDSNPRGTPSPPLSDSDPLDLSRFFAVDSLNIHRLIIAGITTAAKFFSDVFYTNSRYAKVGGLPLPELNHLELNFLLLNDFRLTIPMEEMDAYATMLVEFYAREIVAQRQGNSTSDLVSD